MNMHTNFAENKILKSYTIVPSELYVARQADRQLKKILEDKGRPGYVLVSRQMGKTNLLLNAKRGFQSKFNHFIYLDISNNFPDLSSFFRNIIDVAIDSFNFDKNILRNEIHFRRTEGTFANYPHKEHEQELRYLLSQISGDITICLDEIDAIIKTNYSDAVFSFIRSIYFSGRVNFPEFERLTYILSGVAEPSELIKDKASSPFNIGEKIYLDDFSLEEFNQFISNTNINISTESKNRVFYWTNGNPRLTWDIFSKVEDIILEGVEDLTPLKIDEIVKTNYLSAYDLPPIDHIRNLVEEDADIRSCLIALHYGKSDTLTAQQKSKLYLSGIIGSSLTDDIPKIKNKIIAESLSESWLKEIDNSKLPILDRANKLFETKQFSDAISFFMEYIDSISDESTIEPIVFHRVGSSHYELGNFEEAYKYLCKKPYTDHDLDLSLIQSYLRGMCNFFTGDIEKSKNSFTEVISKSLEFKNYKYYYDASINLSSALIESSEPNYQEIHKITLDLLNTPTEVIEKQAQKNLSHVHNLYSVANLNLFKISQLQGLDELALTHLSKAIDYADELSKVGFILELLESKLSPKSDEELLNELRSYIYGNRISLIDKTARYPNAFDYDKVIKLISHFYRLDQPTKVQELVDYLSDPNLGHKEQIFDILYTASCEFITKSRSSDFLKLSKIAFALPEQLVSNKKYHKFLLAIRILLDENNGTDVTEYELMYTDTYWATKEKEDQKDEFSDMDYKVLEVITHKLRLDHKSQDAIDLIEKFKNFKSDELIITADDPLSITKNIIVSVRDIMASIPLLNDEEILIKADYLNQLFESKYSKDLVYFNHKVLEEIKKFNNSLINKLRKNKTLRHETPKYGRNQIILVRFEDGKTLKGKYKNLRDKIDSGECEVIEY